MSAPRSNVWLAVTAAGVKSVIALNGVQYGVEASADSSTTTTWNSVASTSEIPFNVTWTTSPAFTVVAASNFVTETCFAPLPLSVNIVAPAIGLKTDTVYVDKFKLIAVPVPSAPAKLHLFHQKLF
jgi:hypothetical protein